MKYLVESNNKIIAINDNGVVCDFTYKDKDLFGRKRILELIMFIINIFYPFNTVNRSVK